MCPPREINLRGEAVETGITGPSPKSPPKERLSPTFLPIAGIRRAAVVLKFAIPIAASSAIIAEITSAGVSPGITIISSPTEQTAVIASSFSIVSVPFVAAAIIPASSVTGMNAPERPPTLEDAITPPFLTASFKSASAAVVPQEPHCDRPISSKM